MFMTEHVEYTVSSERELDALAAKVAVSLPDRLVVALIGTLGAGKTRWVQGLAEALGVPREQVTSPTFVLSQEYVGTRLVRHVDLYRIADEDEFWELGAEEWFTGDGITCIEWADRWIECLPPDRLEVHLEILGPTERRVTLRGTGPASQSIVERLANTQAPVNHSPEPGRQG